MRKTNVCLNRVYQVLCKSYLKYVKFEKICIPGAHANSGARKKKCAMKSERRKQTNKQR